MAKDEPWTHHEASVNGIRLHWVEQGRGPLVVLLHGFPEFWYSWRKQIPVLAERFRVVAPDLRGYNLSEKPPRGYDVETLTDDILALLRALGEERADVVGHDWGGLLAWIYAIRFPAATRKLVIMNAPHPRRFEEEVRRPRQFFRSTYALFFKLPRLPELMLGGNHGWFIGRMLRRTAVAKEAFTDEDLVRYREAISRPGALRTVQTNSFRQIPFVPLNSATQGSDRSGSHTHPLGCARSSVGQRAHPRPGALGAKSDRSVSGLRPLDPAGTSGRGKPLSIGVPV